jgi:hypothetical protein
MATHHKIWADGKNPHRRNNKGKKKPQALRQAKKRRQQFKKRFDASFFMED